MASPIENVLKGIRTILLGNGFSKGLLLLFEFWLAIALGLSGFGYYAIALTAAQLGANVCLMGLNFGAIQYMAIYHEKENRQAQRGVVGFVLLAVLTAGGLAGGSLVLGADWLAQDLFSKPEMAKALLFAGFLLPVEALNQAMGAIFRGLRQYKNNLVVLDLTRNILALASLPLIFWAGLDAAAVLMICLLGSLIGLCYGLFALFRQGLLPRLSDLDMAIAVEVFGFSKLLFLWNILQVLAVRLFILASGVFLTAAETGILAITMRLILAMLFFQTAVNATVQTEFARFFHLKDTDGMRKLYQAMSQGLLGVVAIVALAILIDPSAVLSLFGEEALSFGWVVWPMIFANFINVIMGPAGQLLVANEKQKYVIALTVVDFVMQVSMVVPLMAFYGVWGASLGEAARILLFVFLRMMLIHRTLDILPFARSYFKIAGLFVVMLTVGVLATQFAFYPFVLAGVWLFYGIGMLGILLSDKDMQDELKILLTFRRPRSSGKG